MARWISRERGVSLEDTEEEFLDYIQENSNPARNLQPHLAPLDQFESEDVHDINNYVSDSEEESDDEVPDLDQFAAIKRTNTQKLRAGVSAEAYGNYNQKGKWVPIEIPKSQEAKKRIQQRMMHSFLFKSLEDKDKQIVINAMDERKYRYAPVSQEGRVRHSAGRRRRRAVPGRQRTPQVLQAVQEGHGPGHGQGVPHWR